MWLIFLTWSVLAAPPPMDEVGRLRTTGGVVGPQWGLWGDMSVNTFQRLALRAGTEVRFVHPAVGAHLMVEAWAGPYWFQPLLAAGGTLTVNLRPQPVLQPGWRVETGFRALVRWGAGIKATVALNRGLSVEGRVGGYLEW
ncbi:MAG: hypothetical protein HN348_22205 [Proteobacteria bacterium]|nr:hypothetical protein [Pseudomonadota bacterium]